MHIIVFKEDFNFKNKHLYRKKYKKDKTKNYLSF